ncbi:MAG: hypothetical protein ACQ9ET_05415 [Nitrosomonadaceae bacterium]|jgi:hypothetical protein
MAGKGGRFTSENQPKGDRKVRGKDKRTLIIDALIRQNESEESFYDMLVTRAFNPEDNFAAKEILLRLHPLKKAVLPLVNFDFDPKLSPKDQASQVLEAAAKGEVFPDVAVIFINAISSMLKIEEVTELRKEVEEIKKMLGIDNG